MAEIETADRNLFMICEQVNEDAFCEIPEGFHLRTCRKEELDLWKSIHFDRDEDKVKFADYMTAYFDRVYAPAGELFFDRCLFLCEDGTDKPVSTCFAWKAYDRIQTIHWFKTLPAYEGRGLGRALLTIVMRSIPQEDYPVLLHTQPESYRAIGLYTSFGFSLVTNETIGYRYNHIKESLPDLERTMRKEAYAALRFAEAPASFDAAAKTTPFSQF